MAQKLHDSYGFDYANLKVLLGGWNTWKEKSAQDPKGYPIGTGAGSGGSGATTDSPAAQTTVELAPAPVQATP
ncbi:MAG: hypothetical protein ABI670_17625 [Chloroflexota bacterium]